MQGDSSAFVATDEPPVYEFNLYHGCYAPEDARPDAEQIVTDIPRLNMRKGGRSRVQLLTRDLTTPAVGFWHPARKQALFFLTGQGDARGDTLLEIEENPEHDEAWLRFTLPGVREERHALEAGMQPSPDRGFSFAAGDTVDLNQPLPAFNFTEFLSFDFGPNETRTITLR